MVMFITFLFAVYFVQTLTVRIQQWHHEDKVMTRDDVDVIINWFGSVQDAMLSLLMITTGGADWREVYKALQPAGAIPCVGIVFYVALFTIAVWNVVTSTFVDKALQLAKISDEAIIREARRQAQEDARELRATFRKMDLDCNGKLD